MAKRRMLYENLISSDDFCELPHAAQVLYLHLNMAADDDGMIGNAVRLARSLGIQKRFITLLSERGYLIIFESGIVAITHWLSHNRLRRDRYTKTRYQKEFSCLKIINGEFYEMSDVPSKSEDFCQPNDAAAAPECSVDDVSIEKERLTKESADNVSVEAMGDIGDACRPTCPTTPSTSAVGETVVGTSDTEKIDEERDEFLQCVLRIFMFEYKIQDIEEFVKYNDARNWRGENGESVKDNLYKYIDLWMKHQYKPKLRA